MTSEALRLLNSCRQIPRLVVFDLDYTLWPFWCECKSKRDQPSLYPQARGILAALKHKGVSMAVASRSPTPDTATAFLKKLDLTQLFVDMQIYSSWTHKVEHFQKIQQKTGVPYGSMLFFDDENRNIQAVSQMGVKSVLVDNGVNLDALSAGLNKFPGPPS